MFRASLATSTHLCSLDNGKCRRDILVGQVVPDPVAPEGTLGWLECVLHYDKVNFIDAFATGTLPQMHGLTIGKAIRAQDGQVVE